MELIFSMPRGYELSAGAEKVIDKEDGSRTAGQKVFQCGGGTKNTRLRKFEDLTSHAGKSVPTISRPRFFPGRVRNDYTSKEVLPPCSCGIRRSGDWYKVSRHLHE